MIGDGHLGIWGALREIYPLRTTNVIESVFSAVRAADRCIAQV